MTTWDGKESNSDSELERELHQLQRDRAELKSKVDVLQDTVRKLEAERRLARPALRSKSHDRQEKSVYYSDLDSGKVTPRCNLIIWPVTVLVAINSSASSLAT